MYLPQYDKSKIDLTKSEFFSSNIDLIKDNEMDSDKLKRIFCRIVFRTPVTSLRSDINGLDLYTVSLLDLNFIELNLLLFFSHILEFSFRY